MITTNIPVTKSNIVSQPETLTPAERFAIATLDGSGLHYGIVVTRFNAFVTLITSWHCVEQRLCVLYVCDGGSLDIGADRDEAGQRALTVRHLRENGRLGLAQQIADEFPAVVGALRVDPSAACQWQLHPVGGFYL